ncbi:MAG: transglycosylase SLT domain-containing protein, partial [Syntrophaceae bacterium]|nr:transglycosylase SLT domain-containing protein [Syntrophaceae bacterium]
EQTGLQNKFLEGLIVSGEYLGKIEEIFVNLGMPRELTRLIFVESMFNIRARSKVGASGVWQFMPDTAKRYIIVNDIIDERNDPIKATLAAAKLLKHNYDELKTWPLAINAYNSGAGRMKKAVKQLGTRSIEKIIHNFEDKSGYGFASRNFYPSFLAALEVAENNRYYFGEIELESPQRYDQIITTHPTSITELAKLCNISIETLKHLNTALNEKLFEPLTYLPKGYELRVPNDKGNHALIIMRMMAEKEGGVKWHTASKNEGVSNLAKKYNVPAWKIRKDNNLWGTKLAQGQVVKISK